MAQKFNPLGGDKGRGDFNDVAAVVAPVTPGGINKNVQFNDNGSFGGTAILYWDKTNNRLGLGTNAPALDLHIIGGFQVEDSGSAPVKGYRFRTSGSNLDIDFSGKDAFLSVFQNASFGGTQYTYFRLEAGVNIGHAIGKWLFDSGPFGGGNLIIDGATGSLEMKGPLTTSSIVTATATSTIAATTYLHRVDTATNTNQTLPAATAGKQLIVKNVNTGIATLIGTVDGVVNPTLPTQYKYMHMVGNGTNWDIIGNN